MLVADHVGHRARLHPLQAVQAAGAAAEEDAVDQVAGLVLAEGLGEHAADVAVGADAEAGLVADDIDELAHHLLDLLALDVAHLRHGHADPLHLLRPEVTQHLGGVRLAEREQEDRGLVDLVQFAGDSVLTHRR
ncbi:hypothetical protein D9M69_578480 [compost metagenome]